MIGSAEHTHELLFARFHSNLLSVVLRANLAPLASIVLCLNSLIPNFKLCPLRILNSHNVSTLLPIHAQPF